VKKIQGISIPNPSEEKKENRKAKFYSPGFTEPCPIPVDSSPYLEFNVILFVYAVCLLKSNPVRNEQQRHS
jgi:hypothetical protein